MALKLVMTGGAYEKLAAAEGSDVEAFLPASTTVTLRLRPVPTPGSDVKVMEPCECAVTTPVPPVPA